MSLATKRYLERLLIDGTWTRPTPAVWAECKDLDIRIQREHVHNERPFYYLLRPIDRERAREAVGAAQEEER